jgi:hypothetical protein
MSKVTCGVSMSLDGFIAGHNMTLEHPFGTISPMLLNGWQFNEAEKNKAEKEALVAPALISWAGICLAQRIYSQILAGKAGGMTILRIMRRYSFCPTLSMSR